MIFLCPMLVSCRLTHLSYLLPSTKFTYYSLIFLVVERGVNPTQDLQLFPKLTFAEVESFAKNASGCTSTNKAYKFFAEPGYLHNIQGMCKEHLSMSLQYLVSVDALHLQFIVP